LKQSEDKLMSNSTWHLPTDFESALKRCEDRRAMGDYLWWCYANYIKPDQKESFGQFILDLVGVEHSHGDKPN
jgi:hypothetical protein